MAIVLHDKFDSWQEFQDKLDAYCKETYQSFVKDDSKMVESVNKHRKKPFPHRAPVCFREDVICVHYGKKHEQKGRCLQAKDSGFVAAALVTIRI